VLAVANIAHEACAPKAFCEAGTHFLGATRILARGSPMTEVTEAAGTTGPPSGSVLLYLVQSHDEAGASGYGTATAPWPAVPTSCDGGCP